MCTVEWLIDNWHWHMYVFAYTMKYYSIIKNNGILSFASWTNQEDPMLSEISQPQEDKYHMIPLTCGNLRKPDNIEVGGRMVVVTRGQDGQGQGQMGRCLSMKIKLQ